jgi:hypothetical protein
LFGHNYIALKSQVKVQLHISTVSNIYQACREARERQEFEATRDMTPGLYNKKQW